MSERVPPLAERQRPALSETLTGPKSPDTCQSCSVRPEDQAVMHRWVECDPWDRPTDVRVFLCESCSKRLVTSHARLYRSEHRWLPHPGAMPCCVGCRYREGVACTHPAQKRLGGPGLGIHWTPGPTGALNRGKMPESEGVMLDPDLVVRGRTGPESLSKRAQKRAHLASEGSA